MRCVVIVTNWKIGILHLMYFNGAYIKRTRDISAHSLERFMRIILPKPVYNNNEWMRTNNRNYWNLLPLKITLLCQHEAFLSPLTNRKTDGNGNCNCHDVDKFHRHFSLFAPYYSLLCIYVMLDWRWKNSIDGKIQCYICRYRSK